MEKDNLSMKNLKKIVIFISVAILFTLPSSAWSKKIESDEERVPKIISSPTIPYPEGIDPNEYTEQFDVQKYEQDELNLNNIYAVCGDSVVDDAEECDDGNREMGDGCSDLCFLEDALACGNGQVDPGETCDDGNRSSSDGCSQSCQLESICGNGKTEGTEECDDGNQRAGDGCSVKCLKENREDEDAVCGDGIRDSGEECDDRNQKNGDGCSSSCKKETGSSYCGDGVKDSGEECDDGNQKNDDGCSSKCVREKKEGFCGDGVENLNEECDDGNRRNGDGCSSMCLIEKVIDDPPPICEADLTKQVVTYVPGQAKVIPSGCSGTCVMKVIKDNCGKEIGEPLWLTKEDKILQGTYTGINGAEISCQTGQAAQNEFTRFQELGTGEHQKAVVIDCEL